MSLEAFETLLALVSAKTAGWDDALIAAWPCLSKNKVQVAIIQTVV